MPLLQQVMRFIQRISDLGLTNEPDLIERRRIRLLNQFCLIGIVVISFFVLLNLAFGTYTQAFMIAMGLPLLIFPSLLFNHIGKAKFARVFFVLTVLLYVNITGYYSVFNFSGRDNEIFLIGFSTLIIVLYDDRRKNILFAVTVISALIMKASRISISNEAFSLNFLFSLGNMAASFVCIYFFTSLFRKDLVEHMSELEISTDQLNRQQKQIVQQRDAIEANRLQLQSLFDNVPIYLAMFDLEGRYKLFNSWYLRAFPNETKETLLGKKYDEAMNPELAELSKYPIENSILGKSIKFNKEIPLPNGEMAHVYGKYVPLFNHKKEVNEILVYATDVTKLANVEKMLKESNAVKNRLIGIVSHDLRSPIYNLKSLLDLPKNLNQDEFKMFTSQIKNQVNTVSFTMENIFSWVQTQLENFTVNPKNVNVAALVEECIKLYQQQTEKKSIQIENSIDPKATIFVDEDNLSLVCRNLIHNSLKFTPKNGRVSISLLNHKNHSVLTFLDSGIGMKEDHINAVINGKSFSDSTIGTDGEKGSGLGLTFCKDLLSLNNAQMEIESQPNHGTKVDLIFTK
ncbi:MAG: PAS domain-containing protein [Reichenbachiella sp.]